MSTVSIAAYLCFQITFGFTNYQFKIAKRAYPEDLSLLEIKMWCENTLTSLLLTVLLLVARVNGICYLLYIGYTNSWLLAASLFAVGVLATAIIGGFIRRTNWAIATAGVCYLVFPITGFLMWLTM